MGSMTPREKAAQRSHYLLPLVAIALIGCLGGREYKPDGVSPRPPVFRLRSLQGEQKVWR